MATVGELKVNLVADDKAYKSGITSATKETDKFSTSAVKAEQSTGKLQGAFQGLGSKLAAIGIAGAVAAIAKAAFDLGNSFSEAEATIGRSTGAIGADLSELTDSFQQLLGRGVINDINDVAGAFGEINTRFGLTGDQLVDLTDRFDAFSIITGSNVVDSVQNVSKVMESFSVEGEDAGDVLDKLARAAQISGANVDDLSGNLQRNATTLQAVGFGLDESIALLSSFEKQGINTERAFSAINLAVGKFAQSGVDIREGFSAAIEGITGATSETEAFNIAVETFGSRAGPEMVRALSNGSDTLETFEEAIRNSGGAVEETLEATQTWDERMSETGNRIAGTWGRIFGGIVEGAGNAIAAVGEFIFQAGSQLGDTQKNNINAINEFVSYYNRLNSAGETVLLDFETGINSLDDALVLFAERNDMSAESLNNLLKNTDFLTAGEKRLLEQRVELIGIQQEGERSRRDEVASSEALRLENERLRIEQENMIQVESALRDSVQERIKEQLDYADRGVKTQQQASEEVKRILNAEIGRLEDWVSTYGELTPYTERYWKGLVEQLGEYQDEAETATGKEKKLSAELQKTAQARLDSKIEAHRKALEQTNEVIDKGTELTEYGRREQSRMNAVLEQERQRLEEVAEASNQYMLAAISAGTASQEWADAIKDILIPPLIEVSDQQIVIAEETTAMGESVLAVVQGLGKKLPEEFGPMLSAFDGFASAVQGDFVGAILSFTDFLGAMLSGQTVTKVLGSGVDIGTEMGKSLLSGLKSGMNYQDIRDMMIDQLRQAAIETALMQSGFMEEMQNIGNEVWSSVADGILTEEETTSLQDRISGVIRNGAAITDLISGMFGEDGVGGFNVNNPYDDAVFLRRFASGTDYAPGGMSLVGEEGPELVNLPRGSQVFPADQTAGMMGGGNTYVTINSPTQLDPVAVANHIRNTNRMQSFHGRF